LVKALTFFEAYLHGCPPGHDFPRAARDRFVDRPKNRSASGKLFLLSGGKGMLRQQEKQGQVRESRAPSKSDAVAINFQPDIQRLSPFLS
jgi:hypothetical protein